MLGKMQSFAANKWFLHNIIHLEADKTTVKNIMSFNVCPPKGVEKSMSTVKNKMPSKQWELRRAQCPQATVSELP